MKLSEKTQAPAQPAIYALELAWLEQFKKQHGRSLRVLHIGNIANNAYLNAKFLRSVGVEADVLCYNYYHCMACPEWEEVEIKHPYGDDFFPHFSPKDLQNYQRPDWFVQGPLQLCFAYLQARNHKQQRRQKVYWLALRFFSSNRYLTRLWQIACYLMAIARDYQPKNIYNKLIELAREAQDKHAWFAAIAKPISQAFNQLKKLLKRHNKTTVKTDFSPLINKLISEFDKKFPNRPDRLTAADIAPYLGHAKQWQKLFVNYDIIQCYSTDPVYGLLFSDKPYVAFEHGTLRTFTMEDNPLHRLTSLAYRQAQHAFITNGDCLAYAEKLKLQNYSAMLHPVDVLQHRRQFSEESQTIKAKYDADILLFCPLRHDWEVKGTDIHLRALPLIKAKLPGKKIKLLLTSWGAELAKSRALVAELGCSDNVAWLPSLSRITVIKLMQASDVVLDQMALPHFGGTAPQALATGTPTVMSYDPSSTEWIIKEPAPLLAAFTPEQVADCVLQAVDNNFKRAFQRRAMLWIDNHHHTHHVIHKHLTVYRKIMEEKL